MDIQKVYDAVQLIQHDLLWARLASVGVQGRMLAAIKSQCASDTLSMKIGSTAGAHGNKHTDARLGCPLRPTLVGISSISFDGLHQQMSDMATGVELWPPCTFLAPRR